MGAATTTDLALPDPWSERVGRGGCGRVGGSVFGRDGLVGVGKVTALKACLWLDGLWRCGARITLQAIVAMLVVDMASRTTVTRLMALDHNTEPRAGRERGRPSLCAHGNGAFGERHRLPVQCPEPPYGSVQEW